MTIHNKTANKKLMSYLLGVKVLVIILSASSYAQTGVSDYFKKAEESYNSGNYFLAAKYYEYFLGYNAPQKEKNVKAAYISKLSKSKIKEGTEKSMALYKLAESYHKLPNYSLAELYGNKAVTALPSEKYPLATYWYASALKANGRFEESEKQFLQFIQSYPKKDGYKEKAQQEIQSLNHIRTELQTPGVILVTVNNISIGSETIYGITKQQKEGKVLFTSTAREETGEEELKYQTSIYQAELTGENLTDINKVIFESADKLLQYGEATLSNNGKCLFFTGSIGTPGVSSSAIYKSKKEGNQWSKPVLIGEDVNRQGYNSRQPMLTADNKYLFFSSDRPGGQGKYDIWYVPIDTNYNTGKAINAGKTINTQEEESSPFYHDRSKTLFFSSKGKTGMGGFDIYRSAGNIGEWQETVNLGRPYNSVRDDLYFFSNQDNTDFNQETFFSSDRNTDCCLELFKATTTQLKFTEKEHKPKPVEKTDSLVIYFDFDRSAPGDEAITGLNRIAEKLIDKSSKIKISGYTDAMGSTNYNISLAKKRIESCMAILKQKGIQEERLIINIGASCCPVMKETFNDGSDNPEARRRNRRVVIEVIEN